MNLFLCTKIVMRFEPTCKLPESSINRPTLASSLGLNFGNRKQYTIKKNLENNNSVPKVRKSVNRLVTQISV